MINDEKYVNAYSWCVFQYTVAVELMHRYIYSHTHVNVIWDENSANGIIARDFEWAKAFSLYLKIERHVVVF